MSKKALKILAARSLIRKRLIEERGERCEARTPDCIDPAPLEMHEILSRGRGGDVLDTKNILLVCSPCNYWIHNVNPAEAEKLGLLASQFPRGRKA